MIPLTCLKYPLGLGFKRNVSGQPTVTKSNNELIQCLNYLK